MHRCAHLSAVDCPADAGNLGVPGHGELGTARACCSRSCPSYVCGGICVRAALLLRARRTQRLITRSDCVIWQTRDTQTVPETSPDPMSLPANLPEPVDDGAADHLLNSRVPDVSLPATDGREISLAAVNGSRVVVYAYPRTGRPGESLLVDDWDLIPGARGCTPETCGFRDHHADLRAAGAEVFGLSTQDTSYQQELVGRLHRPLALPSDAEL